MDILKNITTRRELFNFSSFFLLSIYILPIFTVFDKNIDYVISVIVLVLTISLSNDKKFNLILPILLFYYNQLTLPGGLVVFRLYTLIYIIKYIMTKKFKFEKRFYLPMIIVIIYCLFVVSYHDFRLSLSIIFDYIFIMLYISNGMKNYSRKLSFYKYFIFGVISSSIYGFIGYKLQMTDYVLMENKYVEVVRFLATFQDPNYAGFFFNIAIFLLLSQPIFKKEYLKRILLVYCYIVLLATLSMTGLLCNIFILAVYIMLKRQVKFKTIISFLLLIGFIAILYQSGTLEKMNLIKDIGARISVKMNEVLSNDLGKATTNRSNLWEKNLIYFWNQSTISILFGGNYLTNLGKSVDFNFVSHQTFIDLFIDLGLLGTLAYLANFFIRYVQMIVDYFHTKNNELFGIILIECIWLFYAFGLSMFPSWEFQLFFFL